MKIRIKIPMPLLALIIAVALFLLSGLLPQGFSNIAQAYKQAMNILRLASFLGIIAAGQMLVVIGGGGGIDMSLGAMVTLSAVLTFNLMDGKNSMILPSLLLVLAVGACIGFLNGIGITFLKIYPLVMTLGMAGVIQGIVLVVTRGVLKGGISPFLNNIIVNPLFFGIPGAIIIWVILGFGIWLLLERTYYGKQLFSIGVNRTTAHLSGVRVNWIIILTYTFSGMLAAFGGYMLVGYTQMVLLNLGNPYLFPSIAAVAIGGTAFSGGKGSYFGTMAGAIVLTLVTSLLTTINVTQAVKQIILGSILLLLLLVYGRQKALRQ